LAESHRIGLAHGRIGPSRVKLSAGSRPKLDFTGVDADALPAQGPLAGVETACQAPECGTATDPDRAADIYGLGVILVWWLTGAPPRARDGEAWGAIPDPPGALLRAMLAADPAERPTASEVEEHLASLTMMEVAGDVSSRVTAATANAASAARALGTVS